MRDRVRGKRRGGSNRRVAGVAKSVPRRGCAVESEEDDVCENCGEFVRPRLLLCGSCGHPTATGRRTDEILLGAPKRNGTDPAASPAGSAVSEPIAAEPPLPVLEYFEANEPRGTASLVALGQLDARTSPARPIPVVSGDVAPVSSSKTPIPAVPPAVPGYVAPPSSPKMPPPAVPRYTAPPSSPKMPPPAVPGYTAPPPSPKMPTPAVPGYTAPPSTPNTPPPAVPGYTAPPPSLKRPTTAVPPAVPGYTAPPPSLKRPTTAVPPAVPGYVVPRTSDSSAVSPLPPYPARFAKGRDATQTPETSDAADEGSLVVLERSHRTGSMSTTAITVLIVILIIILIAAGAAVIFLSTSGGKKVKPNVNRPVASESSVPSSKPRAAGPTVIDAVASAPTSRLHSSDAEASGGQQLPTSYVMVTPWRTVSS